MASLHHPIQSALGYLGAASLAPLSFLCMLMIQQCLAPGSHLGGYADDMMLYTLIESPASLQPACDSLLLSVNAPQAWGKKWRNQFEPTKSQALIIDLHRPSSSMPQTTLPYRKNPRSSSSGILLTRHFHTFITSVTLSSEPTNESVCYEKPRVFLIPGAGLRSIKAL